jgi:hypothetical protein
LQQLMQQPGATVNHALLTQLCCCKHPLLVLPGHGAHRRSWGRLLLGAGQGSNLMQQQQRRRLLLLE